MASFAPVYRPSTTQQSFLARQQKRERKRKRIVLDHSDELSRSPSAPEQDAPRVLHAINRTDPHYVAGLAREESLPGGNFPHAAVGKEARESYLPAEEELSRLNPPIYVPKIAQTDHASSLKARHLDNLTTILHNCMLKEDWERASRAWGLILRTEIAGRGVDVRNHGRWTIGAEILMRREQISERFQRPRSMTSSVNEQNQGNGTDGSGVSHPVNGDECFKRAREYYDRLIVQYPHLQRTHHSITSALSIHPARFSLWIHHVQDKAARERRKICASSESTEAVLNSSPGSDRSDTSNRERKIRQIKSRELQEALDIARQLDDLLVSPPYDSSHEMLYTRGMVALWLYDLQSQLWQAPTEFALNAKSDDGEGDTSLEQIKSTDFQAQRRRAGNIFQKLLAAGMDLPPSILAFLDEDYADGDQWH